MRCARCCVHFFFVWTHRPSLQRCMLSPAFFFVGFRECHQNDVRSSLQGCIHTLPCVERRTLAPTLFPPHCVCAYVARHRQLNYFYRKEPAKCVEMCTTLGIRFRPKTRVKQREQVGTALEEQPPPPPLLPRRSITCNRRPIPPLVKSLRRSR